MWAPLSTNMAQYKYRETLVQELDRIRLNICNPTSAQFGGVAHVFKVHKPPPVYPRVHTISIRMRWWKAIASGQKTAEGRTLHHVNKHLTVGDIVVVKQGVDRWLNVKVTGAEHFSNFKSMLQWGGVKCFLPNNTTEKAFTLDSADKLYKSFPTYTEMEAKPGKTVLGFQFAVMAVQEDFCGNTLYV